MTISTATPEQPTGGEIMRAIGRVEKTLDQQGVKIDRLDDKLDGHSDHITRHDVEIQALRKDHNEFRQEVRDDKHARSGIRGNIGGAVAGAVAGGALGGVIQLVVSLVSHH